VFAATLLSDKVLLSQEYSSEMPYELFDRTTLPDKTSPEEAKGRMPRPFAETLFPDKVLLSQEYQRSIPAKLFAVTLLPDKTFPVEDQSSIPTSFEATLLPRARSCRR
jgi:hypothetical protein